MTKTKLIALVAAFALMLMGVGYSYWSQNIPITMTGRLGTFRVDVTNTSAVNEDGQPQDPALASARREGNVVVLTAAKLLPNSARYYTVTFKNSGDADAVLDKIVLTPQSGGDVLGYVGVKIDNKQRVDMGTVRTVNVNKQLPSGSSLTISIKLTLADDAPLSDEEQVFEIEITPHFAQD